MEKRDADAKANIEFRAGNTRLKPYVSIHDDSDDHTLCSAAAATLSIYIWIPGLVSALSGLCTYLYGVYGPSNRFTSVNLIDEAD